MKNNKHYAYESPFEMVDAEGVKYTLVVEQDMLDNGLIDEIVTNLDILY